MWKSNKYKKELENCKIELANTITECENAKYQLNVTKQALKVSNSKIANLEKKIASKQKENITLEIIESMNSEILLKKAKELTRLAEQARENATRLQNQADVAKVCADKAQQEYLAAQKRFDLEKADISKNGKVAEAVRKIENSLNKNEAAKQAKQAEAARQAEEAKAIEQRKQQINNINRQRAIKLQQMKSQRFRGGMFR